MLSFHKQPHKVRFLPTTKTIVTSTQRFNSVETQTECKLFIDRYCTFNLWKFHNFHFIASLILNFVLSHSSYRAQLEKVAELEKEKQRLKDHASSLEDQLVLKGRAVKEAEGRIEQVEEKHKEVTVRQRVHIYNIHDIVFGTNGYALCVCMAMLICWYTCTQRSPCNLLKM